MTIAACYVCPEGVVLGSDSTATFAANGFHYDYTQKVFEVGESGTLGIVTWGLGGFPTTSYRTLIALFAERLQVAGTSSVEQAANEWVNLIWPVYCSELQQHRAQLNDLSLRPPTTLTEDEERELNALRGLGVGFCIGGTCGTSRTPHAFEILISPDQNQPPVPEELEVGVPKFWGWSNLIDRLHFGIDNHLFEGILQSGNWNGTPQELYDIVEQFFLVAPNTNFPIRDAIDWVYSSIYTTIKSIKFSRIEKVCGGPIEIAVVTTDRRFRWVRHKELDAAIT